jgi:hypothetical protein
LQAKVPHEPVCVQPDRGRNRVRTLCAGDRTPPNGGPLRRPNYPVGGAEASGCCRRRPARRYQNESTSLDDLVQVAMVGVIEAVDG